MEKQVRAHLIISGKVQGVFFRAETRNAAEQYGVFGWVRNRRDGTVEAIIEGDENRVQSLIEWCKEGPPYAKVSNVDVEWEAYSGKFKEFEVTF